MKKSKKLPADIYAAMDNGGLIWLYYGEQPLYSKKEGYFVSDKNSELIGSIEKLSHQRRFKLSQMKIGGIKKLVSVEFIPVKKKYYD